MNIPFTVESLGPGTAILFSLGGAKGSMKFCGVPKDIRACLENDFVEAATRADEFNGRILPLIARYIFNVLPSDCWGSKAKVAAWLGETQA